MVVTRHRLIKVLDSTIVVVEIHEVLVIGATNVSTGLTGTVGILGPVDEVERRVIIVIFVLIADSGLVIGVLDGDVVVKGKVIKVKMLGIKWRKLCLFQDG